jgi:PAS domain-containing protein
LQDHELIGLLETVLGPVVADLSASLNELLERTSPPATEPRDIATRQDTVTTLLSSRPAVGLALLDTASLRIQAANLAFLQLLGKSGKPADAVDRRLDELAPQLAGTEMDDAFKHVAATGYTFAAIIADNRATGTSYLRCALSPIRQGAGVFTELLLTLIDITGEVSAREAHLERHRASKNQVASVEGQSLRVAVRSTTTELLAGSLSMEDALARLGEEIVAERGDCCAIFALGEGDLLQLATLAHRDASQSPRLRAAFAEDAPQPDADIIGQVAVNGTSLLVGHWGPQHTAQVSANLREDFEAAHIESLVCVPLRSAPHIVGVLVVFSTQANSGGTGRIFQSEDETLLQEVADQIAQAIQTVLLREDLRITQAEHVAVLDTSSEGIAIYDAAGRLRSINPVGRQLLSRPAENGPERGPASGPALFKRTFLDPDGHQLQAGELPWSRALRGEHVGALAPVPIIVEWAGGAQRLLHMRAAPIAEDAGGARGAIVTMREAPAAPLAGHGAALGGEVAWAHWRETMELLDEAVVLCDPTGAALFVNAAGRALLNLPAELVSEDDSRVHGNVWEYVYQPDGTPLREHDSPAAHALVEGIVRGQAARVAQPDGTSRTVVWDARRIDREDGTVLGVALIAWPVLKEPIDTQTTQPVPLEVAPAGKTLPTTTLLPGRSLLDHLPATQTLLTGRTQAADECDLTEVCAREARAHHGTEGRRLEIRLPRRRVLVPARAELLERAVTALISTAADALPAGAPLHLAVWIERSATDGTADRTTLVPPAFDIGQLNTLLLTPDRLAEMAPPTRAVTPGHQPGVPSAAAIVRICSPNVRLPVAETAGFVECRALVEQVGGRAWARVDPVLGPTYSFSVPVSDAQD